MRSKIASGIRPTDLFAVIREQYIERFNDKEIDK